MRTAWLRIKSSLQRHHRPSKDLLPSMVRGLGFADALQPAALVRHEKLGTLLATPVRVIDEGRERSVRLLSPGRTTESTERRIFATPRWERLPSPSRHCVVVGGHRFQKGTSSNEGTGRVQERLRRPGVRQATLLRSIRARSRCAKPGDRKHPMTTFAQMPLIVVPGCCSRCAFGSDLRCARCRPAKDHVRPALRGVLPLVFGRPRAGHG
jgi:hypothetical protein